MQIPKKLLLQGIKTKIITPKDNLLEVLTHSFKKIKIKEKDIIVISSKIVAVTQGRVQKITSEQQFQALVQKEADEIFDQNFMFTKKNGIFIPWAGIDRSNAPEGEVILWPKNPFQEAQKIQKTLKKKWKLKELGVLIIDSNCHPLRKGVSGVVLGYAGFLGIKDLRGQKDIYGKPLKITQQAIADNLASAAQLIMGESDEKTPIVLVKNAPVQFTSKKINPEECLMSPNECLFAPLYGKIKY